MNAALADFLDTHRDGKLADEIVAALSQVTESVRATGKTGSVTLKIIIEPFKKRSEDAVIIADALTVKLPAPSREASVMFIGDGGRLQMNDPRQRSLKFAERPPRVDPNAGVVNPVTGEVTSTNEPATIQAG